MGSLIDKKALVTGLLTALIIGLVLIKFTEEVTVNGVTTRRLKFGA